MYVFMGIPLFFILFYLVLGPKIFITCELQLNLLLLTVKWANNNKVMLNKLILFIFISIMNHVRKICPQ